MELRILIKMLSKKPFLGLGQLEGCDDLRDFGTFLAKLEKNLEPPDGSQSRARNGLRGKTE